MAEKKYEFVIALKQDAELLRIFAATNVEGKAVTERIETLHDQMKVLEKEFNEIKKKAWKLIQERLEAQGILPEGVKEKTVGLTVKDDVIFSFVRPPVDPLLAKLQKALGLDDVDAEDEVKEPAGEAVPHGVH